MRLHGATRTSANTTASCNGGAGTAATLRDSFSRVGGGLACANGIAAPTPAVAASGPFSSAAMSVMDNTCLRLRARGVTCSHKDVVRGKRRLLSGCALEGGGTSSGCFHHERLLTYFKHKAGGGFQGKMLHLDWLTRAPVPCLGRKQLSRGTRGARHMAGWRKPSLTCIMFQNDCTYLCRIVHQDTAVPGAESLGVQPIKTAGGSQRRKASTTS